MASEEDTAPPAEARRAPQGADLPAPAAPVPTIPLPPVIGGKYRPLRLIAKGGMGAVYEVVHVNTGEHLALKLMLARSLLAPELVERFRREARVHSSIRSENVVRVVDADVAPELDDAPFLVMELLTGQDFERLCLRSEPSALEVVDWLRQLSPALDKAHKEGIVHRDLKPENLFLAEREELPPIVKILDFGIAKMAAEGAGPATMSGQILGTPRYMSPEQAIGAKEITAAADRFALGLIAFRLLGRRHYFAGESWIGLLREVARGPRTAPSEMGCERGPAFDAWFARACAFEPRARFPSCLEQAEALARALESTPATARRRRPARAWLALAAAGGLALLGWGIERARTASPVRTTVAAAQSPLPPAPSVVPPPWPIEAPRPTRPIEAPSLASPNAPTARPVRIPAARHFERRELARANAPVRNEGPTPTKPEPKPDPIWDEP